MFDVPARFDHDEGPSNCLGIRTALAEIASVRYPTRDGYLLKRIGQYPGTAALAKCSGNSERLSHIPYTVARRLVLEGGIVGHVVWAPVTERVLHSRLSNAGVPNGHVQRAAGKPVGERCVRPAASSQAAS